MSALSKFAERLWRPVLQLTHRYIITAAERTLVDSLDRVASHDPSGRPVAGRPIVLVEAVEDHYYLAMFAHVVARLSAEQPIEAQQFVPRSLRPGNTRSLYQAVKSVMFYNLLTDRKWKRLYAAFCRSVAYRSASAPISRATFADLIDARRIWRNLESKESLLELTVSGVKVGDLIYDTYLRFKPAATVNLNSRYLWIVIWQTLRDLRAAHTYMRDVKPKIFLATYSTYIQHGIAVRVALAAGVKVFTFGNYHEFYKQLDLTDWVHTRNPDGYREGFARLDNPEAKIAQAGTALAARLSGKVDTATAYMQRSAYEGSATLPDGLAGSLMLFLHDFFDSPHCYRWIIFPDFWDWVTFTLNTARRAGIKVFVKPHPNQVASSTAVVRQLMTEYPEAVWVSASTSNLQLAEAGIACAVTIYGTVAHEMAYLGIPSIAAAHNPHISFSFCHAAHSRDEYSRLIVNYRKLSQSPEKMRRESLEFYWMQNLAVTAEQARLRDIVIRFRMLVINKGGELSDGADFLSFSQALNAEPAFHRACKELASELADGPGAISGSLEA